MRIVSAPGYALAIALGVVTLLAIPSVMTSPWEALGLAPFWTRQSQWLIVLSAPQRLFLVFKRWKVECFPLLGICM